MLGSMKSLVNSEGTTNLDFELAPKSLIILRAFGVINYDFKNTGIKYVSFS